MEPNLSNEVLPVYNHTSSKRYGSTNPVADWATNSLHSLHGNGNQQQTYRMYSTSSTCNPNANQGDLCDKVIVGAKVNAGCDLVNQQQKVNGGQGGIVESVRRALVTAQDCKAERCLDCGLRTASDSTSV